MKLLPAALALSLAGGVALAQPKQVIPLAPTEAPKQTQPQTPKSAPAPAAAAPAKKSPAAPAASKKAEAKKAGEAPLVPMDGVIVARGAQGYLGVAVVGGTFVVKFYDEKKLPKTPDVAQISLRWQPKNRNIIERALLSPTGANAFGSSKTVQPPFNFKLYITMLGAEGAETGESFVLDFTQ